MTTRRPRLLTITTVLCLLTSTSWTAAQAGTPPTPAPTSATSPSTADAAAPGRRLTRPKATPTRPAPPMKATRVNASPYKRPIPLHLKCSHRGLDVQNTIVGGKRAVHHGARCLEGDVRPAIDCRAMSHDDPLSIATNGMGTVSGHTCAYLRKVLVKPTWIGARMSMFTDWLRYCRNESRLFYCFPELKQTRITHADAVNNVIKPIANLGARRNMMVLQVDSLQVGAVVRQHAPWLKIAYVGFENWPDLSKVKAADLDIVIVSIRAIARNRTKVAEAHRLKLQVCSYGSSDPRVQSNLFYGGLGVDCFIGDGAAVLK